MSDKDFNRLRTNPEQRFAAPQHPFDLSAVAARLGQEAQADEAGCALQVPWDASGAIKLWMHLTDTGYEKCWGHFGPIAMSSTQVLQDPSGMVREFHTDDFDKDFKLIFTIKRNFPSLPSIEVGDQT